MSDAADLTRAAAAGDPHAQVALAHRMLTGEVLCATAEEPFQLLAAACAQKCDEALVYQAALAALGLGCEQNLDQAYALVAEAAALGHEGARGQVRALGAPFDLSPWLSPPKLVLHAAAPRIYSVEAFLPAAACQWLIQRAQGKLQRAQVRTGSTSAQVVDRRTSTEAGSSMLEPDLVLQLTRLRIAATIDQSVQQLEPTNVMHYDVGQEFAPHYDFVRPDRVGAFAEELEAVGQRCATVLVYLNEGYHGGETDFPLLNFRFKGKTGDALIFWNVSQSGGLERNARHAGLPVTAGEKWLLSQWVRQRPLPLR
jgi:hypothetical protein